MIPKTLYKTTLLLVTPCFCAGAEQTEPELRAPSFRGELRWWFRCLGGTKKQEEAVFGSAAGDSGQSSAVAVLLSNIKDTGGAFCWEFERPKQNVANSAYITYFLSANENSDREDSVVRTHAYLQPGTEFTLELRQLRPLPEDGSAELLLLAWRCMCNLGSVGARKTRGLGAYSPKDPAEREVDALLQHELWQQHFVHRMVSIKVQDFRSPTATTKVLTECARRLKDYRKGAGIHPTPTKGQKRKEGESYGISVLGNAVDGRQTSAVRFRPALDAEGMLQLYIYKAPAITVGEKALEHDIPRL